MTIAYKLGNALYLNITNKCPCDCTFCLRNTGEGVNHGESLWLEHEPTLEEVFAVLSEIDFKQYQEVVFCGYGEPTERLDILLKCARFLKENQSLPIRLNTNGLSDLINSKKTALLLAEHIDCISISLNAPDAASYNALCAPTFGEGSFEAIIQFAEDCKECVQLDCSLKDVILSVVGNALDDEAMKKCQDLCDALGIPLRVR